MIKSGRNPIYDDRCTHPSQLEGSREYLGEPSRGRRIRPDWCPIRGDAQAEKEAEQD